MESIRFLTILLKSSEKQIEKFLLTKYPLEQVTELTKGDKTLLSLQQTILQIASEELAEEWAEKKAAIIKELQEEKRRIADIYAKEIYGKSYIEAIKSNEDMSDLEAEDAYRETAETLSFFMDDAEEVIQHGFEPVQMKDNSISFVAVKGSEYFRKWMPRLDEILQKIGFAELAA